MMTCVLAREVRPSDVVGVGLGTPLALAACLLAKRLDAPDATLLVGGAVSPRATLDECLHHDVAGRTPGYVPHLETMDMAERQAMTLQFLRPGPGRRATARRTRAASRPEGRSFASPAASRWPTSRI